MEVITSYNIKLTSRFNIEMKQNVLNETNGIKPKR